MVEEEEDGCIEGEGEGRWRRRRMVAEEEDGGGGGGCGGA